MVSPVHNQPGDNVKSDSLRTQKKEWVSSWGGKREGIKGVMLELGLRDTCRRVQGRGEGERYSKPSKECEQNHGGMKMHPKFKQSQASNNPRVRGQGMKLEREVETDCEGPSLPV